MDVNRINSAIEVLRYAIENGVSAAVASEACGYTPPYIKNTKRDVITAREKGNISFAEYQSFMEIYDQYSGAKAGSTTIDVKVTNKENGGNNQRVIGENVRVEKKGEDIEVTWVGDKPSFDKVFDKVAQEMAMCGGGEYSGGGEETKEDDFHKGYPPNHIKTLNELLERTGVDTNEWEVVDYLVNKWDVTSWKMGYPQTWENFQVKAKVSKIKTVYNARESAKIFKEIIKEYKPVSSSEIIPANYIKFKKENNLLELALYDLHIGKLAWAGETGENFDVKIAMKRYLSILETILTRANGFSYNKILFPIGNDFFNSDNLNNTTTAGTPQQEDLRWKKTFKMGIKLIIAAINMLKETGVPVVVMVVPGNHDFERSYYLGEVLDAWFNIDEQVTIDNSAPPRKYFEFGKVLLGLTHGNEEKPDSLPLLMATEQKEAWGRTSFHEWHLGHFHKKRNIKYTVLDKAQVLNEELGVTVRYLSSLTGTEEWHNRKGYVGTQKAGEAFVWNDKTGMIAHLNANFIDFEKEH